MRIVDFHISPDCRPRPVDWIEERISTGVVARSKPFPFHYSRKSFGNVQMRGIRRNVEEKDTSFFRNMTHLSDFSISMHAGIVEHNKCFFVDSKGELFEKGDNLPCINGFTCAETCKMVIAVNYSKDIQLFVPFRSNIDVFSRELPSIRDVAFGADMRFVHIKKVYFPFTIKVFKFLQLQGLILVGFRRGHTPWTFSYTSIPCAKADKKRRDVNSLASLPEDCCPASLAGRTLCRSDSMALRTASSSEQSIIGLRPCPGRVCKPLIPSISNRFTQPLRLWAVISFCSPTWRELRPSGLSNTARQRMRKQWLSPVRKPKVSSFRPASLNNNILINILIFIRYYILYVANIQLFYYMRNNYEHLLIY